MPAEDNDARRQRERLRRRFRPDRTQMLFIGESPPASGRFFYQGDSGLYRAMRDVFLAADPSLSAAKFLAAFRASGCYLIDLCPDPVDRFEPLARRAACRTGEVPLTRAIARLQPLTIVTVVRSIEANAVRAAAGADWHGQFLHLPYPGRWSRFRDQFVKELEPSIRALAS